MATYCISYDTAHSNDLFAVNLEVGQMFRGGQSGFLILTLKY